MSNHMQLRASARPRTARAALIRLMLAALVALSLVPLAPAPAAAGVWTVSTVHRTDADIRLVWQSLKPTYEGEPYAVAPSTVAPYAPGAATSGFLADGLAVINFARFLAGLPYDVTLAPELNEQAQYGAVLLASSNFSHTPDRPADMPQAFYDIGLSSTSSSNIGSGYSTAEAFQMGCLADSGVTNITRVGHRRWLLNPPMKRTGIGYAANRITTYAFDRSRPETVAYTKIAWPAEGLFPVEFFDARIPWSVTLDPARYDWDTTGHRVTLTRVADGRTWTLDASDKNTSGEYFNAEFTGYGVPNAFIFRPDPATVSYSPGEVFRVTLSGGIYAEGTRTPVSVTYETQFMSLEAPVEWPDGVTPTEVAGSDRIGTAIAASKVAYPDGADTVVIATAFNWPDALGGAALAGALDAPILLTSPTVLSGPVTQEIARLGATRAVVLGGTGAVSAAVQRELGTLLGGSANVDRIAGADRYETARKVALETVALLEEQPGGYDGTAFAATGANFPDALGASPLSAARGWPIFLVGPAGLDAATATAMRSVGVTRALVLGGTGAVSTSAEARIASEVGCATRRLSGSDRYQTAVAVASFGVAECGLGWNRVAIATGTGFPDALAGGVLQGRCGSVVLLTPSTVLHSSVRTALDANQGTITEVRFLGGTGAVSQTVRDSVAYALW